MHVTRKEGVRSNQRSPVIGQRVLQTPPAQQEDSAMMERVRDISRGIMIPLLRRVGGTPPTHW